MKLGFGDYYRPGPGSPREYLRMMFLERVGIKHPAVLRKLREDFLPKYEVLADNSTATAGEQIREPVTTWASEVGLSDDCLSDAWIIDVAIKTLEHWHSHPSAGDFWVYPTAGKGYLSPFDEEVRLEWDPTIETEGAFTERAQRVLEDYRIQTKDIAQRKGFLSVPERRNPKHLDWLIWWQVEKPRPPLREIADRANVSEDAVRKALKRLADKIGLKGLRKGSQFGRKKGNS